LEAEPLLTIDRWSKKDQSRVKVQCQNIIKEYNKYMGGVDLADMLLALYRIDRRSKKYYNRIIYYLFGVCTINAWIVYKHNTGFKMSLSEFTQELSFSLMRAGKNVGTTLPTKMIYNQKKTSDEIRYDDVGHMPIIQSVRQRCKQDGCTQKSTIYCKKCNVCLCIVGGNTHRNCFEAYHTN